MKYIELKAIWIKKNKEINNIKKYKNSNEKNKRIYVKKLSEISATRIEGWSKTV